MNNYKVEGIIIRKRNFGEGDKILTIFTRQYGKLDVLAKGVRKITSRRGGSIELFNYVSMVLHRAKFLDIVTEVAVLNAFPKVRENLHTIANAYQASELVHVLTREHQESEELFSVLHTYLLNMEQGLSVRLQEMQQKVLTTLGFASEELVLAEELDRYIEQIAERRMLTKRLYE